MEKVNNFFEDWDFRYMNPYKLLILNIILLFSGFGLLKLSLFIGGWWLIVPTWTVLIILMFFFSLHTLGRFWDD